jgi:hypothetical protein
MRRRHINHGRLNLITGALLLALAFRAWVPVGFMPAPGSLFSLEICPEGFPAQMVSHHAHDHSGRHTHFECCPFGSAPAAAPISQVAAVLPNGPLASPPIVAFEGLRLTVRLDRAHQSRAPPRLA